MRYGPAIVRARGRLASEFLRRTGWRTEGQAPAARKCVVVAAPHTSNWDLLYMLAFGWSVEVRPRFMMKHSVFVGPLDPFFRRLGGIPIERHHRTGVVKQMVDAFAAADDLTLVVPPEGTRGRREHWKSGFYHIANEARVPLVLTFCDYSRKVAGFGPSFVPTGNLREDMELVRDFYADKVGRHPELFGPVRLPEEL